MSDREEMGSCGAVGSCEAEQVEPWGEAVRIEGEMGGAGWAKP